jgi:hypothetical protein
MTQSLFIHSLATVHLVCFHILFQSVFIGQYFKYFDNVDILACKRVYAYRKKYIRKEQIETIKYHMKINIAKNCDIFFPCSLDFFKHI